MKPPHLQHGTLLQEKCIGKIGILHIKIGIATIFITFHISFITTQKQNGPAIF